MITESAAYWQEQLDEERARAEDLVDERDQARAERDEAQAQLEDAQVALVEMTRERDVRSRDLTEALVKMTSYFEALTEARHERDAALAALQKTVRDAGNAFAEIERRYNALYENLRALAASLNVNVPDNPSTPATP